MEPWLLLGFKNSETLLGIETFKVPQFNCTIISFKNSETLLGIETGKQLTSKHENNASKTLKPF